MSSEDFEDNPDAPLIRNVSSPVGRGTPLERVYAFFDTRVGLTILGFVLTGMLGGLASFLVNETLRSQDQQSGVLQQRESELSAIHTGIGHAIVTRSIATEDLMNVVDSGASDAEVESVWSRYMDAYRSEVSLELESHLIVTGHTEDDPNPGTDTAVKVLWTYLDDVIQSRFQGMHECLLQVRSTYVAAEIPVSNKFAAARAVLAQCRTDDYWNDKSYLDPKTRQRVSVAGWDGFKSCLEDFTYALEMSARIQRRVWASGFWSIGNLEHVTHLRSPDDCSPDDAICLQNRFFRGLKVELEGSCGLNDETGDE